MSNRTQTPEAEKAIKHAMDLSRRRDHKLVTTEHLLMSLLDCDQIAQIVAQVGADIDTLRRRVEAHLETEETVVHSLPGIQRSDNFENVLSRATTFAKSETAPCDVTHLFLALFSEKTAPAMYMLQECGISRDAVSKHIARPENAGGEENAKAQGKEMASTATPGFSAKRKSALAQFCINLNDEAAQGKILPVIGREAEIESVIRILTRRTKNNPVLCGEAGVGKTAVAEGLARAIHEERVPELLKKKQVMSLNMGLLVAGTRFRGDFEERIEALLREIKQRGDVILFIDEVHTLLGAGSAMGSLDAANILKPALARGEISCIGATTFEEYRRHIEKDAALVRRFQKVDVAEPTKEQTLKIVEGVLPTYAKHHQVAYDGLAVEAAVRLSARHFPSRRFPDKAIDVIDEVGAVVRLKGGKRVTLADVEQTVAKMAKLPVDTVSADETKVLARLGKDIKLSVYDQDAAVDKVVQSVQMHRAGLGHPEKPIGSFLFVGPTGVGKTQLARSLAQRLGLELVRFDMSEYMEKHTVSRLLGSPPGFVGYEEGGKLTAEVEKNPHCVLLLDEIEKAHPDVFNVLLQIMDYGKLTEATGKTTDFRNVILIMTSNIGAESADKTAIGFLPQDGSTDRTLQAVEKGFSPEFRNRLTAIVPFQKVTPSTVQAVVGKFISELQDQIKERRVFIKVTDEARSRLAEIGFDPKMGARPVERAIQEHIKMPLAQLILFGPLKDGGTALVDVEDGKITVAAA